MVDGVQLLPTRPIVTLLLAGGSTRSNVQCPAEGELKPALFGCRAVTVLLLETYGKLKGARSFAGVAELADARDSKSRALQWACRFDSDLRHFSF